MEIEHELKTWEEHFQQVWCGKKSFELRKNDRDFNTGDLLYLREYDNDAKEYTGRSITVKITHILHGGQFGLEEGYCIMSFNPFTL